ncbi:hypothetical protein M5K25_003700 [Dendrobium thyrsiflorum]|uniref:FRIGIDA-like protein n=1 Tax=Dendrobium thyrsiflorum TaxID=117978 RepID=A0ABD0VRM2_DENTH
MKMDVELRAADATRDELIQVQGEIEKLNAARQDLTAQVQILTQDMERASAELQRAPLIKAEIEAMKQEIQRARDCPKEAMEPIATLIFAAARFSDLPELAVLRSLFTKRYGTLMESCIDKKFVEKIQMKSFSKTRKLQLMEDIAQEFSVNWNSIMFENKMSNQSAPSNGNPMKHQLVNKANEKQFPARAAQKHQIQPEEQINFQTTPTDVNRHEHDRTEKTVKTTLDVLEDAKSDHPDKKTNFKTKYKQNENYKNELTFDSNARGKFQRVHEGIGLVATERQPSTDVVNRDFKAINAIPPPYTKLPECSNGSIAVHVIGIVSCWLQPCGRSAHRYFGQYL